MEKAFNESTIVTEVRAFCYNNRNLLID